MMGLNTVNPVRIRACEGVEFTNNKVDSKANDVSASYATVQCLFVVGSSDVLIDSNSFIMNDTASTAGQATYLYAINFGYDENTTISNNNFNIFTLSGKDSAGTAYALQGVESELNIIGNNITTVSNGPNLGIYVASMMGGTSDLYIENNTINVTGYATSSSEWALVSGIEITNGDAKIYNNTIYIQNKAGYVADATVHGVSYAQYMHGDRSLDVQNNTMYVEGDYAVKVKEGTPLTVIGNYLIANELYGDDAVYKNDESVTVENNYPADLNLSVSADNIKVGQDAVINISGYEFFTGNVTVAVNGNEETVTLTKGVGSLTVSDLAANNYTVVVSYEGTKYFNADEANATFEVSKYISEMTVTVGDVEIDKDLTVTVAIPGLTGEVTVIVDGNEGTVSLTDGVGTYTILAANVTYGNHTIVAVFKGNEQYEANFTTANFTVEKTENYTISVNLTVDNIDYGNDLTFNVTLPEDANGQVIVSVDGDEVTYADVVDGNATVTVPADEFTTGINEITVTYSDDKYGEKSVDFNITVNSLPVDLIVTAEDINCTEVEIITVTLPSGIDGDVTVVFQGTSYEIEMTDGVGTLEIPDLTEGTYTAEVYFEDDSVYMDNETTVEFTVSKAEVPENAINVTNPTGNATAPEISISLPEDAPVYC